jgi:hypothetical protein
LKFINMIQKKTDFLFLDKYNWKDVSFFMNVSTVEFFLKLKQIDLCK